MMTAFEEKKTARRFSNFAKSAMRASHRFFQHASGDRLIFLGAYLALGALALAAATSPGATKGYGTVSSIEPVMVLAGPNDGEPINCRTVTPELRTDYRAPATVAVYVNGFYHWSGPLQHGREDLQSGMVFAPIEVDLDAVSAPKAQAGFEGPSSPVSVTVYLYDAQTSEFVGSANWIGRVSRPALEDLGPVREGSGSAPAGTQRALRVRPLPGDVYFIVFAAGSRDALRFSPEDPEAFRSAEVAAGGNCAEAGADPSAPGLTVAVESLSKPRFLVLWTYNAKAGWKSSAILAIE